MRSNADMPIPLTDPEMGNEKSYLSVSSRLCNQSGTITAATQPMSAYQLAKDAARIASTATLSKDVIDLLQTKLSLLTEQTAGLEKENAELKAENANLRNQLQDEPIEFEESMGVLWKRTATGFEQHPYCKECPSHPVMTPVRRANIWVCGTGNHNAPRSVRP